MTPYISLYFFLYLFASIVEKINVKKYHIYYSFFLIFVLIFFVGFRYSVGGDWATYIGLYEKFRFYDYISAIKSNEIFWSFLNVFAIQFNLGVAGVNFIIAIIFFSSLYVFNKKFTNSFYIYMLAFPYFVIIVAMGYSRQCLALSFLILSLSVTGSYREIKVVALLLSGIFFHNSLIFISFLPFLYRPLINFSKIIILILLTFLFLYLILTAKIAFQYYFSYFLNQKVEASGAIFRVIFNCFPSLLFLYFIKNFYKDNNFYIWLCLCLINLSFLVCLIFNLLPSGMIDRYLVYTSLVQLIVYIKIFDLYKGYIRDLIVTSTSFFFFVFMVSWFYFGNASVHWTPYKFKLTSDADWYKYREYYFTNRPLFFKPHLSNVKNKQYLFEDYRSKRLSE